MTDFFFLGWTVTLRILLGQFLHTSSKSYVCWKRDSTHQSRLNPLNATMCPISETNAEWHAETIKSCGWPAAGSPLLNPPHPFFRLLFSFHFLPLYPPLSSLARVKGLAARWWRSKEGNGAGQGRVLFKNTPCGNINMPWSTENRADAGEPSQPVACCPSLPQLFWSTKEMTHEWMIFPGSQEQQHAYSFQ